MAKPLPSPSPNRSPRGSRARPEPAGPSDPPSRHQEALAAYEQAVRLVQQHNFAKAAELFGHLISTFPEERDLAERGRLYQTLCQRHLSPLTAEPRDHRERLYAATLALNAGQADRAISYLNQICGEEPGNDQALYMLAVAHGERREPEVAIRYLGRAIEANPENRLLARVDPDLEPLRGTPGFAALLAAP